MGKWGLFGTNVAMFVIYFVYFLQVIGYTGNEDPRKYIFNGEVTVEKLKVECLLLFVGDILINYFNQEVWDCIFLIFFIYQAFGEDFLGGKLRAFYKSDPIPENVRCDFTSWPMICDVVVLIQLSVSCLDYYRMRGM